MIIALILPASCSTVLAVEPSNGEMDIYAFYMGDTYKGESTLVASKGEYLLMDMGRSYQGDKLVEKLKALGIKKLSVYISHFHWDHDGFEYAYDDTGYLSKFRLGTIQKIQEAGIDLDKIYIQDFDWLYGRFRKSYDPEAQNEYSVKMEQLSKRSDVIKRQMDELSDFVDYINGERVPIRPSEDLGLSVKPCSDIYDGEGHSVSVSAAVSEGTVFYYTTQVPEKDGTFPEDTVWSTDAPLFYHAVETPVTVYVRAENDIYYTAYGSAEVSITKRNVTITVPDAEKSAGQDDPELLNAQIEGAVGSDLDDLDLSVIREKGEDTGTYIITISKSAEELNKEYSDYNFSINNGTFTIHEPESSSETESTEETESSSETESTEETEGSLETAKNEGGSGNEENKGREADALLTLSEVDPYHEYRVQQNRAELVKLAAGDKFTFGDASVDIIGPVETGIDPTQYMNVDVKNRKLTDTNFPNVYENDTSLVAMITCADTKYFNGGDIMSEQVNALIKKYGTSLNCDIFDMNHHGSNGNNSGNTQELLKLLAPAYSYLGNSGMANYSDGVFKCGEAMDLADDYGIVYSLSHEKKTVIYRVKNGSITMYTGDSISESNRVKKGWLSLYGTDGSIRQSNKYYIDDSHGTVPLVGLNKINSKWYLFDDGGCLIYGDGDDGKYHHWIKYPEGWRYFEYTDDYEYADIAADEIRNIQDEGLLYFDEKGFQYIPENTSVFTFKNNDYLCESETGRIITGQWTNVNGTFYLSGSNGIIDKSKTTILFPDVFPDDPYLKPVFWANRERIVVGFEDGTFKPDASCTRLQFVIMIWRLAGKPEAEADVSFKDVSKSNMSNTMYSAVQWAVANGIIKGFSDGTFRPDDTVTRAQSVIMLWRMAGQPEGDGDVSFPDVNPQGTIHKAVQWGEPEGIIKGANGLFMPSDNCLRKHIVIFLYRYARIIMHRDVSGSPF